MTGAPAKAHSLVDALGLDAAVDYKGPDFEEQLAHVLPERIDALFENVGGEVFEAMMPHFNEHAHIIIRGFSVMNRFDVHPDFIATVSPWISDWRLRHSEDFVEGFENVTDGSHDSFNAAPLRSLLQGSSQGYAWQHLAALPAVTRQSEHFCVNERI